MARIVASTKLWPLFVTVMPGAIEATDLREYIAGVNQLYLRRERFATLVDTSLVTSMPSAAERRLLANWQHETVDLIRRYNVFTATVIRSAIVRGAHTALTWLFPPPNEQTAVASLGEGLERCVDRLEADGRRLPAELAALARSPTGVTIEALLGEGHRADTAGPRR